MYSLFTDDNGGGGVLTETYIHIEKLVIFLLIMLEPKLSIRTLITKVIFEWMFLIQAMCKTTHMHNM